MKQIIKNNNKTNKILDKTMRQILSIPLCKNWSIQARNSKSLATKIWSLKQISKKLKQCKKTANQYSPKLKKTVSAIRVKWRKKLNKIKMELGKFLDSGIKVAVKTSKGMMDRFSIMTMRTEMSSKPTMAKDKKKLYRL
jgi:hypothetical protein